MLISDIEVWMLYIFCEVYSELSVLQSCGFDTWCGRARELLQKYSIVPKTETILVKFDL